MGLGKWLENWSLRDLDKWARENPSYEDLRNPATDNEHLFYINHKLRHANTVLGRIERLLGFILLALVVFGAKLLGVL